MSEAPRLWLDTPQIVHILLVQYSSQMIIRVLNSRALCRRNWQNVNDENIWASSRTEFLPMKHILPADRSLRLEISLVLNMGRSTTLLL